MLVDDIVDWESGQMSHEREVKFFQSLVDSGLAWQLQGAYGRHAYALAEAGEITIPEVLADAHTR